MKFYEEYEFGTAAAALLNTLGTPERREAEFRRQLIHVRISPEENSTSAKRLKSPNRVDIRSKKR